MAKRAGVTAGEFGSLFRRFVEQSMVQAPRGEPHFQRVLKKHFGRDPRQLASVSEEFALSERPNLQVAIEEYVASSGVEATLGGIQGLRDYDTPRIATLLASAAAGEGPVQYANVGLDGGQVMACVRLGLYVVSGERREAILIAAPGSRSPWEKLQLEVMAPTRDAAAATISRIRKTMRERNVYRGRVITLVADHYEGTRVMFHALRDIARNDVVLPAGLLERIEQHAIEVPLPDLGCRRRLIDLYAEGLRFEGVDVDALAGRTQGVSGAFIRELLRKAALYAVDAGSDAVGERHLDTALHELTVLGGELTRSILGASSGGAGAAEA